MAIKFVEFGKKDLGGCNTEYLINQSDLLFEETKMKVNRVLRD